MKLIGVFLLSIIIIIEYYNRVVFNNNNSLYEGLVYFDSEILYYLRVKLWKAHFILGFLLVIVYIAIFIENEDYVSNQILLGSALVALLTGVSNYYINSYGVQIVHLIAISGGTFFFLFILTRTMICERMRKIKVYKKGLIQMHTKTKQLKNLYLVIKTFKIFHLLLLLLIIIVSVISFLNTTIFSKESLIEVVQYVSHTTESSISPVDSLYIARVIRQQLWEVHFYVGILVLVFALVVLYYYQKCNVYKRKILQKSAYVNTTVVSYMAVIGILLFYRDVLGLSSDSITLLRDLHWFGIYLSLPILIAHLYLVFTKDEK